MQALMTTYASYPVAFERGDGCWLFDGGGKRHLDLLSGIGVNNLGHCHPAVVEAVRKQAGNLIHTSNLYHIPNQEALASRLVATSFADRVFFCNSGAEANEAAIKLARKFMKDQGQPQRHILLTMQDSFHGRTMATLSATGQDKVKKGYDPLLPGFVHLPFNDTAAVEQALTDPELGPQVAGILVEPVQGESGVRIPAPNYLETLRYLADRHGVLLILDEVQCGMGRTGRLWAHHWSNIIPDIMTAAKALASGLPIGACLATARVADSFTPGSHGSTFGGNPLCSAAALATLEVILGDGFLAKVEEMGNYLLHSLREMASRHKQIKEVRGLGLMAALELNFPADQVVQTCLQRGLLVNCAMGSTIRMLPPLVIHHAEIDAGMSILDEILRDLL